MNQDVLKLINDTASKTPNDENEDGTLNEEFNACDISGGNYDDAYDMGRDDGEISFARQVQKTMTNLANNPHAKGWTDGFVDVSKDGDKFMAVYRPTFTNIQESPVGFGDTEIDALCALIRSQADEPKENK